MGYDLLGAVIEEAAGVPYARFCREALARTAAAGPGVRFAAGGFAVLDRPSGPVLWRGGATDGFTAEIVAALDGSRTVVLLASKSPPEGLREVALRLVAG